MKNISTDSLKNVIIFGLAILLVMLSTYTYFVVGDLERTIDKKDQQIQNLLTRKATLGERMKEAMEKK